MSLRLYRHINSAIPHNGHWVIGNFDGLHKGHKHLIEMAQKNASDSFSGVMSFNPHPKVFFNHDKTPFNVMQLSEKILKLCELNVDYFYLHPFNKLIADMSALEFCQKIKNQLNPHSVTVGYDFYFGKNRSGTPDFLKSFCDNHHIQCTIVEPVLSETGCRYASQSIRDALANGDIPRVTAMLGHDYILSGRVIKGKQLARQLGFPTVNIAIRDVMLPRYGVYTCHIINLDGKNYKAIANIGVKPTLTENKIPLIEIHIPDFNRDLYGQKLRFSLTRFIRDEKKFLSLDALKNQIEKDIREIF